MVAIASVHGLPGGGKNKLKGQQQQQCPNICPANYDPVCAADLNDSKSSPRLFGNKCVLNTHNCEHNSRKY
ncbi:hypothetical protein Phum_PHUM227570 [Pediculus humanus corporis]|uniref:Kazal-like domain-containing protein n=1 Tax=Pediculus humanus subsp. corporis TaxID=121224 RepID=E0VIH3_PEDHC|nr:uncharacterized protein Phum_PHUM227570 [Pediculus humanus corporis]EEB13179.1 hypothetical protein Phum_PHUM227570 [Pediculus humanus corporis]